MKLPPPLIWLCCALMIWLIALPFVFSYLYAIIAFVIALIGSVFALWSVCSFKQQKTTLDPINPKKTTALVITGVFRFSRNPMYLSLALWLLALCVLMQSAVGFGVVLCFVWVITTWQIKREEAILREKFGQDYVQYCKKVRRWI